MRRTSSAIRERTKGHLPPNSKNKKAQKIRLGVQEEKKKQCFDKETKLVADVFKALTMVLKVLLCNFVHPTALHGYTSSKASKIDLHKPQLAEDNFKECIIIMRTNTALKTMRTNKRVRRGAVP